MSDQIVAENVAPAANPYVVEVDDNGCESCGRGKTWTVVGPDGVAVGQSWENDIDAQAHADDMCEAWAAGAGLTAAAPDLLTSLKALLSDIDAGMLVRDVTRDGEAGWSQQMIAFVSRLKAAQGAVAKAEGR